MWIGGVGMPFAFPVGMWLNQQGTIHLDRFLLVYWVCAFVWVASFTHWTLDLPEVRAA